MPVLKGIKTQILVLWNFWKILLDQFDDVNIVMQVMV